MISQLNVYDSNLNKFNLEELGLYGSSLSIPAPSYARETKRLDSGETIVVDEKINPRELTAVFLTKAQNYQESLEQKSLIFALLGNGKELYVEQIKRPGLVWKVHLGEWTPEYKGPRSTFISIPLSCNIGVSQTINLIKKTFHESDFTFNNEGHVSIDSRERAETVITIIGDFPNGINITNKTTGDIFEYYGVLTFEEELKLMGGRTVIANKSVLGKTNLRMLTFDPGGNEISVRGSNKPFELTINTRFYLF